MPIYEYVCENCKKTQEVMQKVSDGPPALCEHCSAQNSLKKTVSSTSFQLKGGGWYKDLYSSAKKEESKDKGKADQSK